jgi:hypothetical protein
MIRKYLFWGLTLVLVVALVNLIIRGRRLEKQQVDRLVEVVQDSEPTATRVLRPQDFEILQSKMLLEQEPGSKKQSRTARHEIEIRNKGKVSYSGIQLSFDYLDRSGRALGTKTRAVVQTILPGATLKIAEIKVDGIPISTVDSRVAIVYADIGQETKSGD